ncbi:Imm32 family immunity protein [soil metagenome]
MMKLTVELQKGEHPEVALCFDAEGLDLLIRKLEHLRSKVDHLHLMAPAWAGQELTEELTGGEQYILINSLRLVRLPDSFPSET